MLHICKSSWVGRGPVRLAPTPKGVLRSPWLISDFLAGNSTLHNVQESCRNYGSWFATMLTTHLTGFLLGCSALKMLFVHCSSLARSEEDPGCSLVGVQQQYAWQGRRERKDEAFRVHTDFKLVPCPAVRNINADPHLPALLQLQLDKDANREKCLLWQEKGNEKLAAAMHEAT